MKLGRAFLYYFEVFTLRLVSENVEIGRRLGKYNLTCYSAWV